MVSINHTMTLDISENKPVVSQEHVFLQNKNKLTFFSVISTKPVKIVSVDNIKDINQNYVAT